MRSVVLIFGIGAALAMGGCPQIPDATKAKTAADYDGIWHLLATNEGANFCLTISGGLPSIVDAGCTGQAPLLAYEQAFTIANGRIIAHWTILPDGNAATYALNLSENTDGSLSGNMHTELFGIGADTQIIMTRN